VSITRSSGWQLSLKNYEITFVSSFVNLTTLYPATKVDKLNKYSQDWSITRNLYLCMVKFL